jgi:hypothetical protein
LRFDQAERVYTQPAIGYAVERGELLSKNEKYDLIG